MWGPPYIASAEKSILQSWADRCKDSFRGTKLATTRGWLCADDVITAAVKELDPYFVWCRRNISDKNQSVCNGTTARPSSLHVTNKRVTVTGSAKQTDRVEQDKESLVLCYFPSDVDLLTRAAISQIYTMTLRQRRFIHVHVLGAELYGRGPSNHKRVARPTFSTDQWNSPQNEDHTTLVLPWKRVIEWLINGFIIDYSLLLIWGLWTQTYETSNLI
jgi:hypothetical protein